MRYLTKEWYLACQTVPMTPKLQQKLDKTMHDCRDAQEHEALPENLRQAFFFHDGIVRQICTGEDLTIHIDCAFSKYQSVTFCSAKIKQELPPAGSIWLYEELYRHKSGNGYEAHILFEASSKRLHTKLQPSDLFELKVICSEILFA